MLEICAFSIVASVLYMIVKQHKPEYSIIVQLVCGCIILLFLLPEIKTIMDFSQEFFDGAMIDNEYFSMLLKALGITLITQFSADTCRDSGDSSLASKVELAGRAIIIVMCLPMIRAVIQMTIGLIKD